MWFERTESDKHHSIQLQRPWRRYIWNLGNLHARGYLIIQTRQPPPTFQKQPASTTKDSRKNAEWTFTAGQRTNRLYITSSITSLQEPWTTLATFVHSTNFLPQVTPSSPSSPWTKCKIVIDKKCIVWLSIFFFENEVEYGFHISATSAHDSSDHAIM